MADASTLQHIETLFQQNKKQEALELYKAVMNGADNRHDLWVNYASFLFRCGLYNDCIAISQKANTFKPSAEAYHNIGCALNMLGRNNDAIEAFKMAINLNYNLVQAHANLAITHEKLGQIVQAIDHQQISLSFDPNSAPQWISLARLRRQAGRSREALSALRTARAIAPDNQDLWRTYSLIFASLNDYDINMVLIDELTQAIKHPATRILDLTPILVTIFTQQALYKGLQPHIENGQIKNFKTILHDKTLNWGVLNLELFTQMLTSLTALGIGIEDMLTSIRFHILESLDASQQTFAYLRELQPFAAALACQCFLNEYIYNETTAEAEGISALKTRIEADLEEVTAYEICVYGTYRPLHTLKNAKEIEKYYAAEAGLAPLLRMQITEPLKEEAIKAELTPFTSIDDNISLLVKAQYETNPYPRWTHPAPSVKADFKSLMQLVFPYLGDQDFININTESPSILVAGCGTGKHSVEVSLQVTGSAVTAIDISSSSLAYASRKSQELGLNNIEYGIADILKITDMNKKFDVIYCGGVLHHMHDPMSGWRALIKTLKPGGYMMISLYSEIARKSIVTARQYIQDKGYKADIEGIRACREDIKLMEMHHPIKPVSRWIDFYTTSSLRDLIFHVQEHRFTARQLKSCISELGLEFMGFQFPDRALPQGYSSSYPNDTYARNLDNWDDFERNHPDLFAGMYNFWVRLPA